MDFKTASIHFLREFFCHRRRRRHRSCLSSLLWLPCRALDYKRQNGNNSISSMRRFQRLS